MASIMLKIKSKSGQQVLKDLNSDSTIGDLKTILTNLSKIPKESLLVLYGFPPKTLDLTRNEASLQSCGLLSGETLILEEKGKISESKPEPTNTKPLSEETNSHISEETIDCPGILIKHIVPADNSCLFNSIQYVMSGKVDDETKTTISLMRQLIAAAVSSDPETFSEAFLGKPNKEYCKWIKDNSTWGGAIEIAILSNYYGVEIAVVDTINGIINRFGEDRNYGTRVFLMFDGIHYDPLYLEPYSGEENQRVFPSEDTRFLRAAEQLAMEAKSSRQFTDVNKFTLKCTECQVHLKGQVEAQQHAKETGHKSFGEVE